MKNAFLIFIIFLLISCSTNQDMSTSQTNIVKVTTIPSRTRMLPTNTPTMVLPTLTNTPTKTPQPTNTVQSTATSTFTPMPTATLDVTCPLGASPEIFNEFESSAELQDSIVAYLNEGGQFTELKDILESLIVAEYDVEILQDMVEADLNGDGVLEILVTVDTFQDVEEHGRFLVLQCLGGKYEPVFVNSTGLFSFMPHPIIVVDLDGDSSDEIIIEHEIRRSAWGWAVSIYDWQENEIISILLDDPSNARLGSGEWELNDVNGDGVQEFVLTGSTIFHPDGGFPRELRQTFELQDSKSYVLLSTEYLPSEFRHHVLEDAQRAFDEGDLLSALSFYDLAAHDDSLTSIGSYHLGYLDNSSDSPNEYQRAFALFRMLIMQTLLEDEQEIMKTIQELESKYSEEMIGGEFTLLAKIFHDEIQDGQSVEEACNVVTNVIQERFPDLESHIGYWGYLNVHYETETICPFN